MSEHADTTTIWRSVTPTRFRDTDDVVWRDGTPRCARHPYWGLVDVTIPALRGKCDGGSHVCPGCMREQLDERYGDSRSG